MSLGGHPKPLRKNQMAWPRTAEKPWLREGGSGPAFQRENFLFSFLWPFQPHFPWRSPPPRLIWLWMGLLLYKAMEKIPRPALPKLLKSLCTDRTMIPAYRCGEKRAHHISYLTQMEARWKGRQFSRLPQVSFGVRVYDFQQPEAYVDNKIATTKMAGYYLLGYKNSPKECSSCFLCKFLCPDSSEAQGTQFLADRFFAADSKFA